MMSNRMRSGRGRGPRHHDHLHGEHGGWGPPGRRDGRRRRGDIRTALLAVLAEGPGHGYELMQRIEDKSGGAWRPSPGSVYPTLQLLEDEGLVTGAERDGKRVFEITDAGREEAERRVEEAGGAPWAGGGRSSGHGRLFGSMRQVALAATQVAKAGTPAQVEQAAAIMEDARKRLYQLLIEE